MYKSGGKNEVYMLSSYNNNLGSEIYLDCPTGPKAAVKEEGE
jgi:hypothetical protein